FSRDWSSDVCSSDLASGAADATGTGTWAAGMTTGWAPVPAVMPGVAEQAQEYLPARFAGKSPASSAAPAPRRRGARRATAAVAEIGRASCRGGVWGE